MKVNIKMLVTNGVLAALYIAVTALIMPFGFSNIQFRISEIFNHLIVFNKKYFWGILIGVFLANLFMSTLGAYEFFGLAHTTISLLITIGFGMFIKNKLVLMVINALVFSFNMYIVAFMLKLAIGLPFLITWALTSIEELTVMLIGIPIVFVINKRIKIDTLID